MPFWGENKFFTQKQRKDRKNNKKTKATNKKKQIRRV